MCIVCVCSVFENFYVFLSNMPCILLYSVSARNIVNTENHIVNHTMLFLTTLICVSYISFKYKICCFFTEKHSMLFENT